MEKQRGKLAQTGNLSIIQTTQKFQPLQRRQPKIVRHGLIFKNTVLVPTFEIPVHVEPPSQSPLESSAGLSACASSSSTASIRAKRWLIFRLEICTSSTS